MNNLTFGPIFKSATTYGNVTPFATIGIGVALPHVEVRTSPTASTTYGYQFGGPSISWSVGGSMPLNDRTSIYGEYKGTYTQLDVDLDGGGRLQTDVITNAINIGLRIRLGRP